MHAAAAEQGGRLSVPCRADTCRHSRVTLGYLQFDMTLGNYSEGRYRVRLRRCPRRGIRTLEPSLRPHGAGDCPPSKGQHPHAKHKGLRMSDLSPKPAHQEVDCRDDFDAVDVGRMAPPANDDDLLITTGDLLERPELEMDAARACVSTPRQSTL